MCALKPCFGSQALLGCARWQCGVFVGRFICWMFSSLFQLRDTAGLRGAVYCLRAHYTVGESDSRQCRLRRETSQAAWEGLMWVTAETRHLDRLGQLGSNKKA